MPADVEEMIYVGQVPWHGIGTQLPVGITALEAVQQAKLNWTVETAPLVTDDAKKTKVLIKNVTRRVEDSKILGIVRRDYVPIQNVHAFEVFNEVLGGQASINTAGSLAGGALVWGLAKLPGVIDVGGTGDEVEKYVLLSNAHDGSRAFEMLFTPIRVVCSNTLSIALSKNRFDNERSDDGKRSSKWSPSIAIRQDSNARQKLIAAGKYMGRAVKYYEKFGDFTNFLATKQLSGEQVKNIIARVYPPNVKEIVTDKIQERRTNVERLFVEGKGHNKIAGSAWALMNAFAEDADHAVAAKKKTNDKRATTILFGSARNIKQKSTDIILRVVS